LFARHSGLTVMPKMKYLLIFGTRPEAIKLAPVVLEFRKHSGVECIVCVTGQHQELLTSVLLLFSITPDYNLDCMSINQQPSELLSRMLPKLRAVIGKEQPDWVLVQGDTMSALAGAMAATFAKVRVAHIEAGIRSHDRFEPFPEEVNRKLISVMADLHFAATSADRESLEREGHRGESIHVTGNTCIDAMRIAGALPLPANSSVLHALTLADRRLILVTVHRRENHGERLEVICDAITTLAHRYHDSAHFLLPMHPNPNVIQNVKRLLGGHTNITLCDALDYREMLQVANLCYFAMIDSGGLQEELPSLGKPALVLRNVTDRHASIVHGAAKLVGTDRESIIAGFTDLMENPTLYASMAQPRHLFGDGTAAQTIVSLLISSRSGARL
jgi:UDP-N-acetylglucosamine 2-epimerase (non-hydrolysing)